VRRVAAAVLAVAAVVLAAGSAAADAPTRTVTMPGKLYDPARLSVLVGTTVTWKNDDSVNHTVTGDGEGEGSFSSGYLPPGGSFTYTFAKQGRYAFHCTIHKFMRGEVDVFGLVLSGPEGPVTAGRRVVFAGLAPPGTESVALRGGAAERTVRARPDGSYAVGVTVTVPGTYVAVAGELRSPALRVRVRPTVHVVRAREELRVSVDPARPGATAVLQSYDRERFAWRSLARTRLDAGSRARFPLAGVSGRARVLVVGTKGWADGFSRAVLLGPAPQ
jgi:plastocyanin